MYNYIKSLFFGRFTLIKYPLILKHFQHYTYYFTGDDFLNLEKDFGTFHVHIRFEDKFVCIYIFRDKIIHVHERFSLTSIKLGVNLNRIHRLIKKEQDYDQANETGN